MIFYSVVLQAQDGVSENIEKCSDSQEVMTQKLKDHLGAEKASFVDIQEWGLDDNSPRNYRVVVHVRDSNQRIHIRKLRLPDAECEELIERLRLICETSILAVKSEKAFALFIKEFPESILWADAHVAYIMSLGFQKKKPEYKAALLNALSEEKLSEQHSRLRAMYDDL